LKNRIVLITAACLAALAATPAMADIVYSGPQNIVLQGAPDSNQFFNIFIAGAPASWDTLGIEIDTQNEGLGVVNAIPGLSEVSLAMAPGPEVTRFQSGDAFPSTPIFGSGSEILWGAGTGPNDGDFYAAMDIPTSGAQPEEEGWIHFNISGSATSSPIVTVKGWAYAVGDAISSIGQTSSPPPSSGGGGTPVPEIDPAAGMSALTLLSGTLLVIRGRRRQPRRSGQQ